MNKLIGSAILSSMLISGIATADNVNPQLETDMMYGHKYTQQNTAMRSKGSQAGTRAHSHPQGMETDIIHQITEHVETMHADPNYGHNYSQQNSAMRSKGNQAGTRAHSHPQGIGTDIIHQITEHVETMHADPSTAPDVRHGDNSETATDIIYHDIGKHKGS